MIVFFDTSSWVKRYVDETGSDEVEKICSKADEIILSILCVPETISSFSRLLREKKITQSLFFDLKKLLLKKLKM